MKLMEIEDLDDILVCFQNGEIDFKSATRLAEELTESEEELEELFYQIEEYERRVGWEDYTSQCLSEFE